MKSPDEIEIERIEAAARDLMAIAAERRLRLRASSVSGVDWLDVAMLPISKRVAFVACRTGALKARKTGRTWLTTAADFEAYLARGDRETSNVVDIDHATRAALGLDPRKVG